VIFIGGNTIVIRQTLNPFSLDLYMSIGQKILEIYVLGCVLLSGNICYESYICINTYRYNQTNLELNFKIQLALLDKYFLPYCTKYY